MLWGSCFCPPSVTLEDGGHQLLRSYCFRSYKGLFWHLLSLASWGKMKLVPTSLFLYRLTEILNAQPYQKFPKLILAGRRHNLSLLAQPIASTVLELYLSAFLFYLFKSAASATNIIKYLHDFKSWGFKNYFLVNKQKCKWQNIDSLILFQPKCFNSACHCQPGHNFLIQYLLCLCSPQAT